jgi:hypothetical protein
MATKRALRHSPPHAVALRGSTPGLSLRLSEHRPIRSIGGLARSVFADRGVGERPGQSQTRSLFMGIGVGTLLLIIIVILLLT